MNVEFDLLPFNSKKDPLSGKISVFEFFQYKIAVTVVMCVILTIYTLDFLNFDIPGWAEFLTSVGIVIAYTFTFIMLFFSGNAGKAHFTEDRIIVEPKKNPDKFPKSPIIISEETEINIYIIQAYRMGLNRTLLNLRFKEGESEKDLGIILKSRQKHKQYSELLDSWYRAGYAVKESDQLGNRVFKLDQGKSYAEIQKIKSDYGIDW